jgi:lipopolysaccharide export system protein LptA
MSQAAMTYSRYLTRNTAVLIAAGFVSCLAVATSASAQSTSQMEGLKLSGDKPIQIASDQLEIKEQEKKAYFTGNVQVVQGTTTMKAGKMTVLYTGEGTSVTAGNANIDKIFLDDTVFLTSGTQQATADKGEFDMASQTFVLSGKQVVLSEGPNVFKGCKLTVQMATGQAKLDPCNTGRIEILLDPKSQQQKPKP